MLVITSAGCNALDYALQGPARVHAVDANPRQTALLELKLAGIRGLDFEDFFLLFGHGRHPGSGSSTGTCCAPSCRPFAQRYWDRNGDWFSRADARDTFYYYGLSGMVARGFRAYLRAAAEAARRHRSAVRGALAGRAARDLRQRASSRCMWSKGMNWTLSRQLTMSMLGVPHPQRREVERQHALGVAGFIREAIEYVARQLPFWTNYFWALYLRGSYTRACCPEYLKPENFLALKAGLVDRVRAAHHDGHRVPARHATSASPASCCSTTWTG